ncbi:MAG: hypothetical protein ACKVJE_17220 [Pseudomonadales bacterium]
MKVEANSMLLPPVAAKDYSHAEDIIQDFASMLMTFDHKRSTDSCEPIYSGEDNGIKILASAPTSAEGQFISMVPVKLSELPVTALCFSRGGYNAILTASPKRKPGTTDQEISP